MTADDEKLRRKLLGAWELVLWKNRRHDEDMDYPFGRDARGLLVYTADGHMSVQMVRLGVQPLGAPPASASIEKLRAAFNGFVGYFGRFTVDAAHCIVVHHIDGAWHPDVKGDQVRHCRIVDDHLFLEGEAPTGWVTIEWRRVGA